MRAIPDVVPARVRYKSMIHDSARWEGFAFRPDDIIISTPAKCGTTWTQMICAMLVLQTPVLAQPLDSYSPWLDMLTRSNDDVFAQLEALTNRRFIKTHTPFDGLPKAEGVTYICVGRDPRDVALSMLSHRENFNFMALLSARQEAVGLDDVAELLAAGPPSQPDTVGGKFWEWVDNATPVLESGSSLKLLTHHVSTYWDHRDDPNVVLIHYDDLQRDLEGSMRGLAQRLAIDVAESDWPALVKAATFDEMKAQSANLVPDSSHGLWIETTQFFNMGTSGQWKTLLDGDDRRRYDATIAELASADMIAWLQPAA